MEVEGQTQQQPKNWNFSLTKHKRVNRIPIDESAWSRNKQGYVLAHDSQYENPKFIPEFLKGKKQKGWSWSAKEDLDGDGRLDTVIYNEKQEPMFWNGFHYVDNYPMLEREKFMMNPENEKYDYMMSKYKYDIKTDFEKVLTDISKDCHEYVKEAVKSLAKRKQFMSDLSSQFFKTFIKQVLLAPDFARKNGITTPAIIKAELLKAAEGFARDENYRMPQHHKELMKLFKVVNKYYENASVGELQSLRTNITEQMKQIMDTILNQYGALSNGFNQRGSKMAFTAKFIL